MLRLNTLLRDEGVDPNDVRLVRHQVVGRSLRTVYDLWVLQDGEFETYQRIQRKPRFSSVSLIATCVATPQKETLFVGMFENFGVGVAPVGLRDPIRGHDVGGYFYYDLRPSELLSEYVGRLVLDWGPGNRSWIQKAGTQNKPIVEIKKKKSDPEFPGFLQFMMRLGDLPSVPSEWKRALSLTGGVYLLSCLDSGKQYVGSAYGEGGFYSRWQNYFGSGHGGNVGLKELPKRDYQVTILEVASSSATWDQIIAIEGRWKDKLQSRKFGFNRN